MRDYHINLPLQYISVAYKPLKYSFFSIYRWKAAFPKIAELKFSISICIDRSQDPKTKEEFIQTPKHSDKHFNFG